MGIFVTVEGVDGAGKTTQMPFIENCIKQLMATEVINTREPGGTPLGETLRSLLKGQPMSGTAQTLLFCAARADHIEKVINPALRAGHSVLSDRFIDSMLAYQGAATGNLELVKSIQTAAMGDYQADVTLFFDVPLSVSKERRQLRGEATDETEKLMDANFLKIRQIFHQLAAENPNRFVMIDGSQSIDSVREQISNGLTKAVERYWQNAGLGETEYEQDDEQAPVERMRSA